MKSIPILLRQPKRNVGPIDEYTTLNLVRPVLKISADGTDGGTNSIITDESVFNRSITRIGDVSQTSISPYGTNWSVYFNGTTDSFVSTNTTVMNFTAGFSVELWFKMDDELAFIGTLPTYTSHLFTGNVANAFRLSVKSSTSGKTPDQLTASAIGVPQSVITSQELNIAYGVWHHVVFVRDSAGNTALFFNGRRVAQGIYTGAYAASKIYIAGDTLATSTGGMFRGYISDVKVNKLTVTHDPASMLCNVPSEPVTADASTVLITANKSTVTSHEYSGVGLGAIGTPSVEQCGPYGETAAQTLAAYCDGDGDYIYTPSTADLNFDKVSFSIECWVRFTKVGTAQVFLSKLEGDPTWGYSWALSLTADNRISGSMYGTIYGNWYWSTVQTGSGYAKPNIWYHVVMARRPDSGYHTLFVNGAPHQSVSTGITLLATNSKVLIGRDLANGANRPLAGFIAGVKIVRGAYAYDPGGSIQATRFPVPTQPPTRTAETKLLVNFQNGQIFDSTGLNSVRLYGAARVDTSFKKVSTGSVYFDGVDSRLTMPNKHCLNLSSTGFTIESWVLPKQRTAARQYLVEKDGLYQTSTSQYGIYLEPSGELGVVVGGGQDSQTISTGTIIDLDVWTHVSVQKRGTDIEVFVNGIKVATTALTATLVSGTGSVNVGWSQCEQSVSYFNGYLDDIRIYKSRTMRPSNFNPETDLLT